MRSGLSVRRQVEMPIEFEGRTIDCGYRLDLLVDESVIIEVKSVNELAPIHSAQLLTYMRLSQIQVGLLMNFNSKKLTDGTKRLVLSNSITPSALSASSAVHSPTGD